MERLLGRFQATNLIGKLANISSEPKITLVAAETIKQLTGEDLVTAEIKGKQKSGKRSHRNRLWRQRENLEFAWLLKKQGYSEETKKRLAAKLQNPRLNKITFHTFRHWKATMLYIKLRIRTTLRTFWDIRALRTRKSR